MVLDSSIIVAIVLQEPNYEKFVDKITFSPIVAIGAPTLVEATIVLSARIGSDARAIVSEFLREAQIEVIPFAAEHYQCALDAFLRYGKGRHKAALNFGDCLSYAVSFVANLPLLYTGDDFSKTDVIRA